MIVWISGPTGAGKSSLARSFRALNYAIVEEKLPAERFQAFAVDPTRHCAMLQEEIMRSRFAGWRAQENSPRLIFDRSVDEDFHVFCRMHWEAGLLGDLQYEHLRELSQTLQSAMPEPDLILFICPERRILAERVTEDSHPPLIVRRLDRQVDLYADWLSKRRNDILRLDNSACSLEAIRRMFAEDRGC